MLLIGSQTMSFSVLTLNLWNINEPLEPRYRALETGLRALRPDIICLQEVSHDPRSARSQSNLVAEACNLARSAEENGLAIVCRYPVVRSHSVTLPEFPGDGPRQVLLAEFLVEGRALLVANTHLAYPPEMTQERKKQADAVMAAIKRYRSRGGEIATILCGDFNDVAESPSVRAILDGDEKFHDVFAECNPTGSGITYSSSQNRYVDPYWTMDDRIDYVFISRDLVPKNCSVVFDGNNGLDIVSDHYGVFCTLDFR